MQETFEWTIDDMLEVTLPSENFLKVKETLTRIGVASKKDKKLFQSCHILHKKGKYYIVHFKELFKLDRKESSLSINDIERRDAIACLLQEWGLLKIVKTPDVDTKSVLPQIKILSHKEKDSWALIPKYTIGTRR